MCIMLLQKSGFCWEINSKLVSKGEKSRFRALEIQTFTGGPCARILLGCSWLLPLNVRPLPLKTVTSGYVPGQITVNTPVTAIHI